MMTRSRRRTAAELVAATGRIREAIRGMVARGETPLLVEVAAATGEREASICRVRAEMVAAGELTKPHRWGRAPLSREEEAQVRALFRANPGMGALVASETLGLGQKGCLRIRKAMVAAGEAGPVVPLKSDSPPVVRRKLGEARGHRKAPADPGEHGPVELPAPRPEVPDPRPFARRGPADDMATWLPAARRAIMGIHGARIAIPEPREAE